ncbi:response regulator [Xanthomonas citri]|uniref:response regulator n=1 Tax=Xanthomonas citri TaxID=346 RepID=UPI0002C3D1D9|nr:response regulator [Xanthomonas citri]AGI06957.1 CheY-like receiver domain protein [Xanthomonas citri subsp. citri Aw12879]AJZ43351.1 Response regulator containing CheY-like receiver, AAA-type ATPase, and DNA-binding domains [Xanthomonas citri pv. citri]AJZ47968.1 Response regulator containing CheY-like receiver, AAA-type ATPase, and DNA-binding domains [Xanthomonas citri pv. citri]AJZ52587.1 Response regulator containing CheY-like receiver, AAA-type ATPase, and DNA-binding domains [Xanthomo
MALQAGQLVLVVEDEPLVRQVAQLMLECAGFTVVVAEDAHRALEVLEMESAVCLIVSDVQMPGYLDGLDLIKHLRLEGVQTPAILTSGRIHPQALPAETSFLPKPYTLAKLLEVVHERLPKTPQL